MKLDDYSINLSQYANFPDEAFFSYIISIFPKKEFKEYFEQWHKVYIKYKLSYEDEYDDYTKFTKRRIPFIDPCELYETAISFPLVNIDFVIHFNVAKIRLHSGFKKAVKENTTELIKQVAYSKYDNSYNSKHMVIAVPHKTKHSWLLVVDGNHFLNYAIQNRLKTVKYMRYNPKRKDFIFTIDYIVYCVYNIINNYFDNHGEDILDYSFFDEF